MSRRRWRDYDDGFDEAALHDDELYELERIRRRPKLRVASATRPTRPQKARDAEESRRIARVKAWGLPY